MLTCTMSQPFIIAGSVRISFLITYFFTLVECDVNLRRYLYTQVGHSRLSSSFSACKSSLRLLPFYRLHHVIFFLQNRNLESPTNCLISFCLCMVGWHWNLVAQYVCLTLYSMFSFSCLCLRRFDHGTSFLRDSSLPSEFLDSRARNKR